MYTVEPMRLRVTVDDVHESILTIKSTFLFLLIKLACWAYKDTPKYLRGTRSV